VEVSKRAGEKMWIAMKRSVPRLSMNFHPFLSVLPSKISQKQRQNKQKFFSVRWRVVKFKYRAAVIDQSRIWFLTLFFL
jgi:hypothetical protein